jgi:hypothetical protein
MSLRITAPLSDEEGRRVRRDPRDSPAEGESMDFYMSRLVKLIPSEAIALFPFLNSRAIDVADKVRIWRAQSADPVAVVPALPAARVESGLTINPTPDNITVFGVAWLTLLVVILLRWHATRDDDGRSQWGAVAIAAVSFILWVPVMNGSFGILDTAQLVTATSFPPPVQKFIPELLLALWTVLVPVFYRPRG